MSDLEADLRLSMKAPAGAVDGLLRRAEADHLVDVAYGHVDSPFGPMLVAATPRGLVRLAYPSEHEDETLEEVAVKVSPRVLKAANRIDPIRRELEEYFAGTRRHFEVSVDWRLVKGFGRAVLDFTAKIPYGELRTYRDVATRAGNPLASRAAGNALGRNPIPIVIPCHRVVRTGGGLGGYTGGLERKEFLLQLEGALLY
jgi:methylated-DNA-[protein]-cysteine S-methyltransferase